MAQRPFVLLDRDGTIVESKVSGDCLSDPDNLMLIDHAAIGLRRLVDLDFHLVVVTNQSAIGRGLLSWGKSTIA